MFALLRVVSLYHFGNNNIYFERATLSSEYIINDIINIQIEIMIYDNNTFNNNNTFTVTVHKIKSFGDDIKLLFIY